MKVFAKKVFVNLILPILLLLAPGYVLGLHFLPVTLAILIMARRYLY